MPKNETLTSRVTRLENAMGEMAEKMNILFDAQAKTEVRFQATDERIRALVVAIGELVNRMPPKTLR